MSEMIREDFCVAIQVIHGMTLERQLQRRETTKKFSFEFRGFVEWFVAFFVDVTLEIGIF
jgi:hypothetical protein